MKITIINLSLFQSKGSLEFLSSGVRKSEVALSRDKKSLLLLVLLQIFQATECSTYLSSPTESMLLSHVLILLSLSCFWQCLSFHCFEEAVCL